MRKPVRTLLLVALGVLPLMAAMSMMALTARGRAGSPGDSTAPGVLEGEVFSIAPNGERYLIPGAQVKLLPEEPELRPLEAASDATGQYRIETVPPGRYRLAAESGGMKADEQWVVVSAGETLTVNIELKLAVVKQSVEVSATVEGIDTSESSATGTVESAPIEDAPKLNARFTDVLPLLPGVVRGPDGLINMKGARTTQSGSLVNGQRRAVRWSTAPT